jgi:hypothetical protein
MTLNSAMTRNPEECDLGLTTQDTQCCQLPRRYCAALYWTISTSLLQFTVELRWLLPCKLPGTKNGKISSTYCPCMCTEHYFEMNLTYGAFSAIKKECKEWVGLHKLASIYQTLVE